MQLVGTLYSFNMTLVLLSEIPNVYFRSNQWDMGIAMGVLINELTNALVTQNGIQSVEALSKCFRSYCTFPRCEFEAINLIP